MTESARRAQIVAAAIEVIAEHGYAGASFARIAKQAGLSSTGLISYHFKGKDDLIAAVVTGVMAVAAEFMTAGVDTEVTFRARLRAFVRSRFELIETYPKHMRALLSIADAVRYEDDQLTGLREVMNETYVRQADRLRLGQAAGELRADFDPDVMTLAINGAINEVVSTATFRPGFDSAAAAEQLADVFDLATRTTS